MLFGAVIRILNINGCLDAVKLIQVTQLGSDIAEGLVVHNIESFISTSIQIASLSEERYFDLKLKIFQRKHLLFGEDLLNSVVGEWRSLLNNLVG